ncbi:MAG: HAD family hydrolase [bacterium]
MIKAVAFDLDGTITRPFLNFTQIRLDIGVALGRQSLLDQLESLPAEERQRGLAILEKHETEAAKNAELNRGVRELLDRCHELGLKCAVITRNSTRSTEEVCKRLDICFDHVITRDSGLPIKPDPAPLYHLAFEWGVDPSEIFMVGDFIYDVQSGKAAGSPTCLVTNGREFTDTAGADHVVTHPGEVLELLDHGGRT